jgi:hypothetical protein
VYAFVHRGRILYPLSKKISRYKVIFLCNAVMVVKKCCRDAFFSFPFYLAFSNHNTRLSSDKKREKYWFTLKTVTVGCGTTVLFWLDVWNGHCLQEKLPRLFTFARNQKNLNCCFSYIKWFDRTLSLSSLRSDIPRISGTY